MVEKSSAGSSQRDAVHAADYQLGADLVLESADLPTKGRLRGVQPFIGSQRQASLLGDGDEIAKVPQLHGGAPYLLGMAPNLQSLLRQRQIRLTYAPERAKLSVLNGIVS